MLMRDQSLSGRTRAARTYVGGLQWAGGVFVAILVAGLLCLRGASLVDAAAPGALVGEEVLPGPKLSPLGDGRFEVTFSYRRKSAAKSVYLAGTFNEWKPTAHKMDGPDAEGRFSTRLKLKEGRYEYKFVLDGQKWKADPENILRAGFHQNSVLYVGTPDGNRSKLAEVEREIMAAFTRAAASVVRIGSDAGQFPRTGVILTADGYVATSTHSPEGQTVSLHLADGRTATGTVLKVCTQWAAGVVKISEPGPWPYVEVARPSDLEAGELCMALEHPWMARGTYDRDAILRIGSVGEVPAPTLRRINTRAAAFGAVVFDREGRLIGMTGGGKPPDVRTVVGADRLMAIRDAVAADEPLPDVYCVKEVPSGDAAGNVERTEDARPDEQRASAALERVKPASVRIAPLDELEYGLSGVIVSAEGHVITCAHHGWLPGTRLKVFLPDGRAPDAMMLGSALLGDVDIGVVKITEKGPWPYVERGDSQAMREGDACLAIGYPASEIRLLPLSSKAYSYGLWLLGYPRPSRPDGQPLVRQVTVVEPTDWHNRELALYTAGGEFRGGDSGGGLFGLDGRVIGIHLGPRHADGKPVFQHGRVELLEAQWDVLNAAEPVGAGASYELEKIRERFAESAKRLPPVAVEVRSGGKRRALGTIVDAHGWILTKASELEGQVFCRLSDGREFPAIDRQVSREHDLALVKIDARDLSTPEWSDSSDVPVGGLVSALRPGLPASEGVVARSARAIPCDPTFRLASLAEHLGGQNGLEMVDNLYTRIPLEQGDVIVDLEGQPTPDREAFLKLDDAEAVVLPPYPGDPIRMGVLRAGRRVELQFRLPSDFNWFLDESEESNRSSGFPAAFGVDVELPTDQCGGPVIDPSGHVIGVTIACREAGVYVIPAATVLEVAETLMR